MTHPCPEASDGKPCRKPLHVDSDGDVYPHAGGHVFASDSTWELVQRGHFDPTAILKGEATAAHLPENCPDPEFCRAHYWDRSTL